MGLFFDLTPEKKKTVRKASTGPKRSGPRESVSQQQYLTCADCGLDKKCLSPKMQYTGEGQKGILIVAEAPGKEEDRQGVQFIGQSGQLVRSTLKELDCDLDRDFWKTSAIICSPPDNQTPTSVEILACRKHLLETIATLKPKAIILMGAVSWESLMGPRLQGRISGLGFTEWVGEIIPDRELGVWVCPVYHPAFILRSDGDPVVKMHWQRNLLRILKKVEESVETNDLLEQVKTTTNEAEAIEWLGVINALPAVAFDYETTGIKPHSEGHSVVSISFSDGKIAWAFPVFESTRFREALQSTLSNASLGKVAHNATFELSWTKVRVGTDLAGLVWDTSLAAHCLCSKKNTRLKFWAYIHFGILGYDEDVDRYIRSSIEENGTNSKNQIKDAPMSELLKYNALDSLLTFKLWKVQEKQMLGFQKEGFYFFLDGLKALHQAHQNGMRLDLGVMAKQKYKAERKLEWYAKKIQESDEAKKWDKQTPFSFTSDTQLRHLFFDILGYKSGKKTASLKSSVDASVLEKLESPLAQLILEYKRWKKALGTYLAQFEREQVDGIVRPFFNLTTVETFRSSSDSPNFQNIPKRDKEVKEFIRKFIVPSKGNRLVEYDYKAAEVCISACYNKDPKLIQYVSDPSSDMHRDVGMQLFIKTKEELTKEERHIAKNGFVFPAFYGSYYEKTGPAMWEMMTPESRAWLASKGIKTVKSFTNHVQEIEEDFWGTRFKVYARWKEETYKEYLRKGYSDLYTGFRCHGPMKKTEVTNYRVQGSAFHVLLWSFIQITREINEQGLKSKLIGQIHDAIVADVVPEEEEQLDEIVRYYSTVAVRSFWSWITVPLTVEKERTEVDGNWAEMTSCGVLKKGV